MEAVLWTGARLEFVEDIEVRPPGTGEVTVRVDAAGLCHSDLKAVDGHIDQAAPVVLGHEACGVVVDRGPGVSIGVGRKVILSPLRSCGSCRACRAGNPTRCRSETKAPTPAFRRRGAPVEQFARVGAFARRTVVHERQVVPIPDAVPDAAAALLGCAVVTGFGAAWERAAVCPGESVLVVGAGGIGLNVVQAARIAGARQILVYDRNPRKENVARRLGATDFRATGSLDEAVRDSAPEGFDAAFECVGRPELLASAVDALAAGGRAVMVGLPPAGTPLTFQMRALAQDKALLGCRMGSVDPHRFIPGLADRYLRRELDIDALVTAVAPLREVHALVAALRAGRLERGVFDLTGATPDLRTRSLS
ncbi:alcohol dehydrogenase catalytic domain-containing protein [Streptomyces sp. CBMA29]|uniref:alcohol dehydrogenase catalytic domain-containing protein n=1 Tax=Streptomyces sp. CBMA29 TaxID=1896314 RepID=UPI001662050F|nr:alcohol dehydrogenase catalytic domain-containing protein [Streptomyces sp. CBMA29]MBD0736709.1 hypothetical protein [Streptomyces sp. CBMA29]